MNHIKGFRTLNRTHSHRKLMFRNMVQALFKNERIQTTSIKAKELRRIAEKIITRAKVKNLHNIRLIARSIQDESILVKLFDEIAPRYAERPGGYTRIIKIKKRMGDGAELSFIELLSDVDTTKKKKAKKKTGAKKVPSKVTKDVATEEVEQPKEEKAEVKKTTKKAAPKVEVKKEEITEEVKTEEPKAE